jgi:predicted ATP-dependent Lon-type protease
VCRSQCHHDANQISFFVWQDYSGYVYLYRIPIQIETKNGPALTIAGIGCSKLGIESLRLRFQQHANAYSKIAPKPKVPVDKIYDDIDNLYDAVTRTLLPDVGFFFAQVLHMPAG